jgi:3-oxoacyl-[acyl-carrier-protein] synthase-3
VAHHVPSRVWTNQDIIDTYGLRLRDKWVQENIGIAERRWCDRGESTSTLAAAVCEQLLAQTGYAPADIDRLIVATVSPDVPTPSTACVTQSLFAPGALFPCVDLVAACGGFLYALDYGRRCVQTGDERVLVVAAEVRSAFLDKQDRRTVMLFGDGAAGVLLERCRPEDVGIVDTRLFADGQFWDLISVPAGGTRKPATAETVAAGEHFITMRDGAAIFERAVSEMSALTRRVCADNDVPLDDVGFFAFHQASANIVRRVCESLEVDLSRTHINFPRLGNCTAASVPLVLSEAAAEGRLKRGDWVVCVATGGGFTAGAGLLRWEA